MRAGHDEKRSRGTERLRLPEKHLKLLGLPFSLPAAGVKFIFQQVADLADHELYDESVVHEELLLLQVQLEEGDLNPRMTI